MSQQFVKNNDRPHPDSPLWKFADDWKVSQKTGIAYCSLDGIGRQDRELHQLMSEKIDEGVIDVFEWQSYYFVPANFQGKWSVYGFENEAPAKKKLEEGKKFANLPPKTNTVPKPAGQQTLRTQPVSTKLSGIPEQIPPNPNIISMNSIFSYTDPQWVTTDTAKQLETQGYSYLPSSLCQPNTRVEDVHDVDAESGNDIVVGEQHLFLMGRIINVKIADR